MLGLVGKAIGSKLGHICYLGQDTFALCNGTVGLIQAGWTIHRNWDHGCLACIPYDFALPKSEEAWKLFDILERSGFLSRDDQATLDLSNADYITSDKVGAFLNSFERDMGKVFAVKCSDGYSPASPASEASGH